MRAWIVPIACLLASAAPARAQDAPAPAPADPPAPPPARVRAWQTGLLRPDRLQHGSLSLTLAFGVGLAADEPVAGFGVALGLGLAKEIRDARHARFDAIDLVADALGATLGAWAARSLTR